MNFLLVYSVSLIGLFFLLYNDFIFNTDKIVKKQVSKVFLVYLVTLAIVEICCHVVGILIPNNNLFISHFYFCFQFIFLSVLFYNLIKNKWVKKIIVVVGIVQSVYLIGVYVNDFSLFWKFNTYEIVSSSLLLIVYAFYFISNNIEVKHQYFNFCVGLIFYLASSITIFLSGNLELVLCEKPYIDIWIFNSIFYIIFQYFLYREYRFTKKAS